MPVDLIERSRTIGAALRKARQRKGLSLRTCAANLGTSPRRLAAIEKGTVYVAAVELELLAELLGIPAHEIWPVHMIEVGKRQIVVEATPGESVAIVVNIGFEPKVEPNADTNV